MQKNHPHNKIVTFNDVRFFLSRIPNINEGGCGVSALSMYRWLEKYDSSFGVDFVFLYQNSKKSYNYYLENSNILKNINKTNRYIPYSCSHVGVVYKDEIIDCNGKINVKKFCNYQQISSIDFIIKSVMNCDCWSYNFNREYIGKIEKVLKINLFDC